MQANVTNLLPEPFARAIEELKAMPWHPGLVVEEIGSPQRIAPHSVAIAAELIENDSALATGRFILLHDPAGNDAWDGTFRIATHVRAEADTEMVTDPLLPEVAWSWLTDALVANNCHAVALAGTVTASHGRGFGSMDRSDHADVELRCSWTPTLSKSGDLSAHLQAWQDLLGHIAGRPPLSAGIVSLPIGVI